MMLCSGASDGAAATASTSARWSINSTTSLQSLDRGSVPKRWWPMRYSRRGATDQTAPASPFAYAEQSRIGSALCRGTYSDQLKRSLTQPVVLEIKDG